jgi:hypothetical protein
MGWNAPAPFDPGTGGTGDVDIDCACRCSPPQASGSEMRGSEMRGNAGSSAPTSPLPSTGGSPSDPGTTGPTMPESHHDPHHNTGHRDITKM